MIKGAEVTNNYSVTKSINTFSFTKYKINAARSAQNFLQINSLFSYRYNELIFVNKANIFKAF